MLGDVGGIFKSESLLLFFSPVLWGTTHFINSSFSQLSDDNREISQHGGWVVAMPPPCHWMTPASCLQSGGVCCPTVTPLKGLHLSRLRHNDPVADFCSPGTSSSGAKEICRSVLTQASCNIDLEFTAQCDEFSHFWHNSSSHVLCLTAPVGLRNNGETCGSVSGRLD